MFDDYNRLRKDDPAVYERCGHEIVRFAEQYDQASVVIACRSLDEDGRLGNARPRFSILEVGSWDADQVAAYLRTTTPERVPYTQEPV